MFYQGATYYISTSPPSDFWERDFQMMVEKGMNVVKHLVVWEDVELDDGEFDFSTVHQVMHATEKYGLDVLLELRLKNRGFPQWFLEKYPDSIPTTADGTWKASGACYNHPKYQEYSVRFAKKVAEELKRYSSIKMWDIWNEPHLFAAGDMNAHSPNQQQCYCKYCKHGFRSWLKVHPEYTKSITADGWQGINTSGMGYYRDYRYRLYFINEVMVSEARRLYEAIRLVDDRPITLHDVFVSPVGNIQGIGNDDWRLADCVDSYGVTGSGPVSGGQDWDQRFYSFTPLVYDETRSAARGKPWLLSEWHVTGGVFGFSKRVNRGFDEIKREYFEALVRGCNGLVTWSYRNFSNTFCLVDIFGRNTSTYEHISAIGNRLREINHFDVMPIRQPEAAIVYDPVNVLKYWETAGNTELINQGFEGFYRFLYDYNVMVDFIHPMTLDKLSQYKTVVLPCPTHLSREVLEAVKEYVRNGGTIISEGLFSFLDGLSYSREGNIPHGYQEVFGCKVKDIPNPTPFDRPLDMKLTDRGGNKFIMAYSHNYEELQPTTATTLLCNENGQAVCTENRYGKGKAILCAAFFSPYITRPRVKAMAEAGQMVLHGNVSQQTDETKNYELLGFLFSRAGWLFDKPKGVRIDKFGDLDVVVNDSGGDYVYRPDVPQQEIFTGQKAAHQQGAVIGNQTTGVFLKM